MNIEKLCRVCLSEFDELTPLWVKLPGENKSLEETINFVVNINIKLEDGLPDKICKICESILDLADTFKKRCLESESILGQQAQKKQSHESVPYCERNQGKIEMSHDSSGLPDTAPSVSHTSLSHSLRDITENIYDLPEHKIKKQIEEHHVDAGVTISTQKSLDTIQDFETSPSKSNEKCFINDVSEKNMKHSDNKEIFSCPHCGQTFRTKTSYKVHILCSCEPKDLKIIKYKCANCKETFTSKDSFEAHLTTHRSQKNSDINAQSSSGGDSQIDAPNAAARSPTEDPAAADTSTTTIIETEGDFEKVKNIRFRRNIHDKKLKVKQKGKKKISKTKTKKESTKDTATFLKLSGTNTGDKITGATETQSNCFSNTVIGATGDTLTCDICGYTATTVISLNSHLKAHAATKRFSCDSCLYLTISLNNLDRHLRTHTGAKPYTCNVCEKQFSEKSDLAKHLKIHTGEKPYSCNLCKKKFCLKSNLMKHLKRHAGDKPYSCNVCNKQFSEKYELPKHLRIHTDDKPYTCNVCEKQFSGKSNLAIHLRTHTGEKPYSCNLCKKKLSLKSNLIKHLRIHTGDKPYSCNVCNKQFSEKYNLAKHLRIHTGDKPYTCNVCEKQFSEKYDLAKHLRIHTGDKPYTCNICEKHFSGKSDLAIHLRTHTGEKPYSCNLCKKKFSEKYNVVKHLRIHTGEKP